MDLRESYSEPMLSDVFKSCSWLPSNRIREYSFAAACLLLLCFFNIAKFIDYLVGDTIVSDYSRSVSCQLMKAYFYFLKSNLQISV